MFTLQQLFRALFCLLVFASGCYLALLFLVSHLTLSCRIRFFVFAIEHFLTFLMMVRCYREDIWFDDDERMKLLLILTVVCVGMFVPSEIYLNKFANGDGWLKGILPLPVGMYQEMYFRMNAISCLMMFILIGLQTYKYIKNRRLRERYDIITR